MTPWDIKAGQSLACRYRILKMLDGEGAPVQGLKIGETAAGPGFIEGTAVIVKRDTEKELLEVQDIDTYETHVVTYRDVWDIDIAEYK
jgi:hypothetical protein